MAREQVGSLGPLEDRKWGEKGDPQEQRDEGCGEELGPSAELPALAIRPLGLGPLHRIP